VVLVCLGDFDSPRPTAPVDDPMMSIEVFAAPCCVQLLVRATEKQREEKKGKATTMRSQNRKKTVKGGCYATMQRLSASRAAGYRGS